MGERSLLFEKLQQLQHSGVPMLEALELVEAQLPAGPLRRQLGRARLALARGATLTDALRSAGLLSAVEEALLAAGEAAGRLDQALLDLATLNHREEQARRALRGALAYPAFLVVMALLLPQVHLWYTQGLAVYLQAVWLAARPLLLGIAGAYLGYRLTRALWPEGLGRLGGWLGLRVPLVSGVVRKLAFARFCRALGALLAGGVPLQRGLALALGALGHGSLQRGCAPVQAGVDRGEPLAKSMTRGRGFPEQLLQRVAIAERSGKLDRTLGQIAGELEDEAERGLRTLLRMLPVLVMVLAAARVATTVIGFYSAQFDALDRLDRSLQQEAGQIPMGER